MSCRSSPAPSRPHRCPAPPPTAAVRARRSGLRRGPGPYQRVGSKIMEVSESHSPVVSVFVCAAEVFSTNTGFFHSQTHSYPSVSLVFMRLLCAMQVCLKMRRAQMCRISLRRPLSWTWMSLDTNPAGSGKELAAGRPFLKALR